MTVSEFFRNYSSDTTAGSANQLLARFDRPGLHTGRVRYRLSHGGTNYALLFSNAVDSTFSDGSISRANDVGGDWEIHSLRVGIADTLTDTPAVWHTVTFDGQPTRQVSGPAPFCTDPVRLDAGAGAYLCYEMTVYGACFPYHEEITLNVTCRNKLGLFVPDRRIPVPLCVACDRPVTARWGFIGDSITQGCGTAADSYTHWVAKIAEGLPGGISVWNLGIGYARGYDAATDGGWLARAKTCDVVHVCFGVNDILRGRTAEEVISDLEAILSALKAAGCRTVLFTVPPFDLSGDKMTYWYAVNDAVRRGLPYADRTFDFAAVLGRPLPEAHLAAFGGHPNAQGCAAAARAFLEEL